MKNLKFQLYAGFTTDTHLTGMNIEPGLIVKGEKNSITFEYWRLLVVLGTWKFMETWEEKLYLSAFIVPYIARKYNLSFSLSLQDTKKVIPEG